MHGLGQCQMSLGGERKRSGGPLTRRSFPGRCSRRSLANSRSACTGRLRSLSAIILRAAMDPHPLQTHPAHEIRIEPDGAGQRIDNFLRTTLKGVPKSHIYRILRRGEVRVNRGRIRQHYRLRTGDTVRIPPLRTGSGTPELVAGPRALRMLERCVVYEDADLLALNKPAGIAVHGGSGLRLGVIEGLRCLRPELRFLDLVHRLDRDTSGLLLIAKRRGSLTALHRAFREGRVDKRYWVLVMGRFDRARRVDRPLAKGILRSGERMVEVSQAGQASTTDFRPVAWGRDCSLLEARPRTGRTHQIRVHAADTGHPVAGDSRYGDGDFNRHLERAGLRRMFLHAHALRFRESAGVRRLALEAPLGPELQRVLEVLGLHIPVRFAPHA